MDLLRQIWARLPLQRIIDAKIELDDLLVAERTRTVNHGSVYLPPDVIDLDRRDRYVKLCTYQGELTRESHLYMWPNHLMYRAIFIGDYQAYHHFSNYFVYNREGDYPVIDDPWFLQTAFETGNPEVMARALSMVDPVDRDDISPDLFLIPDPKSIDWRAPLGDGRTLRDYYKLRCLTASMKKPDPTSETARSRFSFIAGYLGIWSFDDIHGTNPHIVIDLNNYLKGYIIGGHQPPEYYIDVRKVELVVRRGYLPDSVKDNPSVLIDALLGIQPEIVERLANRIISTTDYDEALQQADFKSTTYIVKSSLPRVRRMLSLLDDPRVKRFNIPRVYRIYLLVLLGIPLENEVALSDRSLINPVMLAVLHPSISDDILNTNWMSYTNQLSNICYDPVNFFDRLKTIYFFDTGIHIKLMTKYGLLTRCIENSVIYRLVDATLSSVNNVVVGNLSIADRQPYISGVSIFAVRTTDQNTILSPELIERNRKYGKKVSSEGFVNVRSLAYVGRIEEALGERLPNHDLMVANAEYDERRYQEALSGL